MMAIESVADKSCIDLFWWETSHDACLSDISRMTTTNTIVERITEHEYFIGTLIRYTNPNCHNTIMVFYKVVITLTGY